MQQIMKGLHSQTLLRVVARSLGHNAAARCLPAALGEAGADVEVVTDKSAAGEAATGKLSPTRLPPT